MTDIRIVDGDDSRVYVVRSGATTVYEVDVVNSIVQALPLQQGSTNDLEPLPNSRLATSCVLYGSADTDFLEVLDISSQTSTLSPSSESLRSLAYNPARNELWGTCLGFVGFCVPYQFDVFDATTLVRKAVITGPTASIFAGVHGAFTPTGAFYYQPLSNNRVLVINAATRAVVTQITVGQNPRGVYMQGNSAPKELK